LRPFKDHPIRAFPVNYIIERRVFQDTCHGLRVNSAVLGSRVRGKTDVKSNARK